MPFLLTNCADGGANGVDVTTANSGGASGDAWPSKAIDTGNSITFSNTVARGAMSYRISRGATGEVSVSWVDLPSVPMIYARLYICMPTLPSSSFRPIVFGSTADNSVSWSLGVRTDGKVSIRDAASAQMSVSGSALEVGRWMRIEVAVTVSPTVGSSVVKLYREADSPYPTEVMTSASTFNTQSGGNPIDVVRFGMTQLFAPNYTYYLDDVIVTDAGFLGPAAPAYAPSLVWRNGGGSGANGTLVTIGSSGSATDHYFPVISNVSNQIYHSTAQAAHGTTSYLIQSVSGVSNNLQWRDLYSNTLAARYYLYLTSVPPAATELSQLLVTQPSYEMLLRMVYMPSGQVLLKDRTGTTIWTSTAALPLNSWIRIEKFAQIGGTATTGTVQFAYYAFDGTTAIDSYSSTTFNLNTNPIDRFLVGRNNSDTWTDPFYVDDIAINQAATGFIGPYTVPSNIHTPYAGKIPPIGWGRSI